MLTRLVVTPNKLQLVYSRGASELLRVQTDPAARKEFERLTQELVDAAIEILDLIDGDSDREPDDDLEDEGI